MVQVGWPRPLVTKLEPSQINRLGTSCVRWYGSTTDAPASVECEVVGFYELGDHSIVVGKVTDAHINRDAEALTMKETGWNYGG